MLKLRRAMQIELKEVQSSRSADVHLRHADQEEALT
jgi:hypothetical protein